MPTSDNDIIEIYKEDKIIFSIPVDQFFRITPGDRTVIYGIHSKMGNQWRAVEIDSEIRASGPGCRQAVNPGL
tara:strand:+ start:438 stop:656 length:219 start_codon:yes stop_codon:yes gene_type:complete